jgi:uncharacterized protein YndB with AHSA1/START domain
MSEPVLFEVVIAAPADTVWRALRDRTEIRRWFGWDYDGIDDEIDMIFFGDTQVDDAARTLDFGPAGRLGLEDQSERTIVRLVRAAPTGQDTWDGIYDDINEGWLTFMQQLRFMLERHPSQDREALHIPLTGEPWFETENQVGVINDGRLIIRTPERVIMSRYDGA